MTSSTAPKCLHVLLVVNAMAPPRPVKNTTFRSATRRRPATVIALNMFVSLMLGYGTEGSGTPKNLQRGPQPSLASKTRRRSAGTLALTFSFQASKARMMASLSDKGDSGFPKIRARYLLHIL
eukprot:CAMPEP_0180643638 /NCGR_PEP_ID=MMETSP1037_2-20121125/47934_1 /TAXON_ID=632150 /ORGANISM="Azadinium spinosum, Strain 3D9" /LENGTH=122 /DNA_ID=CAMNT_0022667185 /DNA_START=53 /DNA_END=421 /DNA_ORIENTATION=+